MKKTATMVVIAVGPGGHRQQGDAPFSHSACGDDMADQTAPMISIPVEALSTDSEDGKSVMPEVGDEVELSNVKAIVKKLNEGEAYIELVSINGAPIEAEPAGEKEEDDMPMDQHRMRKMAEKYDSEMEG